MPSPAVVLLLMMMIALTSGIVLKTTVAEETPAVSVTVADLHGHRLLESQESLLKEKTILSQEESIHKLEELVRTLESQLELCRARGNAAVNNITTPVIELVHEIE